jgi:hypothetical protein
VTVHEHVQQVLSAGLDGQADPDRRFLAERHLEQCAACAAAAERFAQVDRLAREVLVPSGPAPFEAALAGRLATRPTRPHPRRRRWQLGLAAALAVTAVVLASVLVPSTGRRPLPLPVPTTAPPAQAQRLTLAAVLQRSEGATSGVQTLTGRFTRTWTDLPSRAGAEGTVTTRYRFAFASPDRLRVEGGPGAEPQLVIADGLAARRVVTFAPGDRPAVTTGVALARPHDQDALAPLSEGLTLWFRNRLEDPERPATVERRAGRPVHVLRLRYERSLVAGPSRVTHLEVWVDPDSYLPVRIRYLDRSRPGPAEVRGEVRYRYERVNRPVPPGAFAVPPGAEVSPGGRFRTMALARARALASYRVPRVTELPRPGWRLLRAGFAPVGGITGAEGANPPGRDLVVAVYGSGLERLAVTTVLVDGRDLHGRAYADPFGGEGIRRPTTRHRLAAGAYAGTVAHLGRPSDDAPYLWFRSGGVVVTISGSATTDELIAAAESLTR